LSIFAGYQIDSWGELKTQRLIIAKVAESDILEKHNVFAILDFRSAIEVKNLKSEIENRKFPTVSWA